MTCTFDNIKWFFLCFFVYFYIHQKNIKQNCYCIWIRKSNQWYYIYIPDIDKSNQWYSFLTWKIIKL